jgi:HNH endonuclease
VADRRYSSSAWQRVRKAVLMRDGHVCQIQGPRCRGVATTVHHVVPSSERPDLFFADQNLVAACTRCNFGHGARVAADNSRRRVAQLERVIREQYQLIQQLQERLSAYEGERSQTAPRKNPPMPAIY